MEKAEERVGRGMGGQGVTLWGGWGGESDLVRAVRVRRGVRARGIRGQQRLVMLKEGLEGLGESEE